MGDNASVRYSGLIEGARQGDAECRERLFALCRSYLGFVARSQIETWLRRKVDASDLVQETMLEAFRDFDHFDGHSEQEWLAWLRKILNPQRGRFRPPLPRHGQAGGRPRGAFPRSGRQPRGRRRPSRPPSSPRPARSSCNSTRNCESRPP